MAAESYCEPADIKNAMLDTDWGTTYDSILHKLASRASRAIDRFTVRRPGTFKLLADDTVYFVGNGSRSLWVELAQAPTSVSVAEEGVLTNYTLWAAGEYELWPYNAAVFENPFQRLDLTLWSTKLFWPAYPKCIKIIGRNGFSIVPPEDVVQATIIQAGRWFKRGQQAFQDTGAIVELGKLTYTKRLDPDVEEILDHYKRTTI